MTVALCHNLRMEPVEPELTERRAMGEVLVAAVMFGTTGTARALGAASASPLGVGAARLAIGGAVLIAIARRAGQRIPSEHPARHADRRGRADRHLPARVLRRARPRRRRRRDRRHDRLLPAAGRADRRCSSARDARPPAGASRRRRPSPAWCCWPVPPAASTPSGIALALLSALGYAGYTVTVKAMIDRGAPGGAAIAWAFGDRRVPAAAGAAADLARLDRDAVRRADRDLPRRRPDRPRVRAVRPRPRPADGGERHDAGAGGAARRDVARRGRAGRAARRQRGHGLRPGAGGTGRARDRRSGAEGEDVRARCARACPRRRRSRPRGCSVSAMSSSRSAGAAACVGSMSNDDLAARRQRHGLPLQVDRRLGRRGVEQLAHVGLRQHHAEQADLGAVGAEDVGERRRDDRAEAPVLQRPRRVLARRARAEVGAGDEDRRVAGTPAGSSTKSGSLAPVEEQELAEAGALDALQELLRDDLVGVDVGAVERRDRARSGGRTAPSVQLPHVDEVSGDGGRRGHLRRDQMRAAAAPWRPSKLRFEVDAQRSPGCRMSGFMPRHIEQPALRHSKPASVKTRSRPSSSAAASPAIEPGTTIARTPSATCWPLDHARPRRAGPRCGRWCRSR